MYLPKNNIKRELDRIVVSLDDRRKLSSRDGENSNLIILKLLKYLTITYQQPIYTRYFLIK